MNIHIEMMRLQERVALLEQKWRELDGEQDKQKAPPPPPELAKRKTG